MNTVIPWTGWMPLGPLHWLTIWKVFNWWMWRVIKSQSSPSPIGQSTQTWKQSCAMQEKRVTFFHMNSNHMTMRMFWRYLRFMSSMVYLCLCILLGKCNHSQKNPPMAMIYLQGNWSRLSAVVLVCPSFLWGARSASQTSSKARVPKC